MAQGGRRIALTDDASESVVVISHTGAGLQTIEDVQVRQYLETDTADIRWVESGSGRSDTRLRITRADGSVMPYRDVLAEAGRGADFIFTEQLRVSNDARWAAMSGAFLNEGSSIIIQGSYALELETSSTHVVDQQPCDAFAGCVAFATPALGWRHDSRGATWSIIEADREVLKDGRILLRLHTRLLTRGIGGSQFETRLQDRVVSGLGFTADDRLLQGLETSLVDPENPDCFRTARPIGALSTSVRTRSVACSNQGFTASNLRTVATGEAPGSGPPSRPASGSGPGPGGPP